MKEAKEWVGKKTIPEAKYEILQKSEMFSEPIYLLFNTSYAKSKYHLNWKLVIQPSMFKYGFA